MGAGRRTETYIGPHQPTLSPGSIASTSASFLHLPPKKLASVVFGCSHSTFKECVQQLVFGLPFAHIAYVEHVKHGMPIFLFNYSDRKMHGIFEAASDGMLNINPYGWTLDGSGKTPFPAQVRVRVRQLCQPLSESSFKEAISDNYYSEKHFWFELNHVQMDALLSLFTEPMNNTSDKLSTKPQTANVSISWKKFEFDAPKAQQEGQSENGWIKPKKTNRLDKNSWSNAAPFIPLSHGFVSAELEEIKDTPEHWDSCLDDDDNGVDDISSQKAANNFCDSLALESNKNEERRPAVEDQSSQKSTTLGRCSNDLPSKREVPSYIRNENQYFKEKPEKAEDQSSQKSTTLGRCSNDLPSKREVPSYVRNENQYFKEEPEKTERELAILEKLNRLQKSKVENIGLEEVEAPSTIQALGNLNDSGPSEWERIARERCLQEQTMLRDERDRLRESLQTMDSSVAKAIQKNLELCAAGIAQMRQDRIELRHVLEDASFLSGLLNEVDQLRKRNAVLEHTQAQMASDLQLLKLKVEEMSQQLEGQWQGDGFANDDIMTGNSDMENDTRSVQSLPKAYLLGGYNGESWLETVDVFRPGTNELVSVASMLTTRSCAAASVLMGQIYVFGGGIGNLYYDTVETYNVCTNEWSVCAPMSLSRGSLAGATVGDRIFALGGGNNQAKFAEVECYDAHLGMWMSSTSMLNTRFGVAAAEIDGALYAVGGYNDKKYLKSVERFDPREALWTAVAPMKNKRGSLSAAVLGGKLYAIGGYDGSEFLKSAEYYEPRVDCWIEMDNQMHVGRAYGTVATIGDSLYVIGGLYKTSYIDLVECYHENTGWQPITSAVVGRRCFLASAVL